MPQPPSQLKTQKSRCVYCGSTDFGKGCRFGPHGVHFHPNNGTKCAYCGSSSYGRGCKLNPTSDLHVHGINYNSMFKEQIQSFLDHRVFLNELKKDYKDFECCKLGIIDQNGNKIKNPITEQEKLSFGPMVKTVLRLKKYLGSKVDLLEASELLEKNSIPFQEDIVKYKKILEYKDKIDTITNELYKTLDEAQQDGIPLDEIKKLVKA